MQKRHRNKKSYFEEQVFTTREYVIPHIESFMPLLDSTNVMEIGCGEGGNLVPFLDRNCRVTGLDISESKIAHATGFLRHHPNAASLVLIAKDVYDMVPGKELSFDLIVMRDVIEHIHDQDRFMGFIKKFLKPGGLFFIAFPPWYNPFGGHQQICKNKFLSSLPYFHLLPVSLYRLILKAGGEDSQKIKELVEIKETGISIERFRKIIDKHNYRKIDETFFLINPNYKIKFGLNPRKQLGAVSAIPYFRNLLTTVAYYVLRNHD
jgi:SAM-dependent methyltransferase